MPRLDLITGLKVCTGCEVPKIADDFQRDRSKPDGLCSRCKGCSSGRVRTGNYTERAKEYGLRFRRENPELFMFRTSCARAKRKNILFTITIEDIHIPESCPVCECELAQEYPRTTRNGASSPSLDKYDPLLGYIPGNVWVICNGCNRRKGDMTSEGHVAFGWKLIETFKEIKDRA